MTLNGRCKILKVYVSEDSRYKKHNLYHAVVLKLKEMGIAGVTVMRGLEGYGKSKALHNAKILDLSSSLPIVIEAIDKAEKIDAVIPVVSEMVNEGLVMTTEIDVIRYGKE